MIVKDNLKLMKSIFQGKDGLGDCIKSLEQDSKIHIDDPAVPAKITNDHYQWQLKRISQRALPLRKIHKIEKFAESHVYIVDSGIDSTHT